MNTPQVAFEDIVKGLREVGITAGDVLMVHSSLKSFGKVDGGADTVIRALLEVLGPTGTLLLPTLTFAYVDESNPFLDIKETPCCTGIIPRTFLKYPGVIRSKHIVSSAAAFGPQADYLTSTHDDTPCDLLSPYGKLYSLGGKVLFIGAGMGSNSLFHVAEELVLPDYMCFASIRNAKIKLEDGSVVCRNFRRYNCSQTGVIRRLDKMEAIFEEKGLFRRTMVGNSLFRLITAKDDVDTSCDLLRNDPAYILSE